MKKSFKKMICITAALLVATSVCATEVELYALDGRTLSVDESLVEVYTADGMGWYAEKPVIMYTLDGRTEVFPAEQVEAQQSVGWYLEEDLPKSEESDITEETEKTEENTEKEEIPTATKKVSVKYTDGTVVSVPAEHVKMYIALDWVVVDGEEGPAPDVMYVTMYSKDGTAKLVPENEVSKYELAGWSKVPPVAVDSMTVYSHTGETKEIPANEYEIYMAEGWFSAYDEALYSYAAFGNGSDEPGVISLLEDKKYELAFNTVKDAIDKLESSNPESEYVSMLYYLRTTVTDTWREAAKSPLGFINYWFTDRGEQRFVIFEYRNISNSRIKSFEINFDICDKDGKVIETNKGSYSVTNLELVPCDKARVGWEAESGEDAASITNVKVKSVTFADGTVWQIQNN